MLNLILNRSPILSVAAVYNENDKSIQALCVENHLKPTITGNIYVGKIVNIIDATEGAFVDIGLSSNGYIQRGTLLKGLNITPSKVKDKPLSQLVKKGQQILCQVDKSPYQTKGAELTTDVSLPGRYVVLMPRMRGVRLSRKAKGKQDLTALEQDVQAVLNGQYGVIIRSAAIIEGIPTNIIIEEIQNLIAQWHTLLSQANLVASIKRLYTYDTFYDLLVSALNGLTIKKALVSNAEDKAFLLKCGLYPENIVVNPTKSNHYTDVGLPLEQTLKSTVIKSSTGVSVTINELEAFTVADVNSGSFNVPVSKRVMVFEANAIAAELILKSILIKNLSGIIMVDFIDMNIEEQNAFMHHLNQTGYNKINGITIEGFTKLGVLEMSRKRESPSLKDLLSFEYVDADYNYWTLENLYYDLKRLQTHTNSKQVTVFVEHEMYKFLRQSNVFSELEIKINLKPGLDYEKKYKLSTAKD